MAVIDYAFYTEEYGGEADETEFNKVLPRAETIFNRLTFHHVIFRDGAYGQEIRKEFLTFTEEELQCIRMAVCSLADTIRQLEAVRKQALSGVQNGSFTATGRVRSMSSGGESVTYEEKATAFDSALTDPASENRLYRESLLMYMQPEAFRFNPFYAGSR